MADVHHCLEIFSSSLDAMKLPEADARKFFAGITKHQGAFLKGLKRNATDEVAAKLAQLTSGAVSLQQPLQQLASGPVGSDASGPAITRPRISLYIVAALFATGNSALLLLPRQRPTKRTKGEGRPARKSQGKQQGASSGLRWLLSTRRPRRLQNPIMRSPPLA